MKDHVSPVLFRYRLVIAVLAAVALAASLFGNRGNLHWWALLITLFAAVQYNYPLGLWTDEISLIPVVALGGGLLFGPAQAGWALALGLVIGFIIRQTRQAGQDIRSIFQPPYRLDVEFVIGLQVIPLVAALFASGWSKGLVDLVETPEQLGILALAPILLYAVLHISIFFIGMLLSSQKMGASLRHNLLMFILIEVIPLPFILITITAYPQINIWTLVILGSISSILAIFIHRFSIANDELEHRVQELSTLNQVSQAMRSSLDLQSLLSVIHQQVAQLLNIDSFYVALFERGEQRIWYPLAVKHGQRQQWPPRPLMPDRLTDRVIKDGKPVLLSPNTQDEMKRTGLPSSEENPNAWMGVPLITSERAIGCLAVFSTTSGTEFSPSDLSLLIILSGQVSVAIENALLYEQIHRRANQMETLNRMSALITASLDLQEVLSQVCRSVARVAESQHSAIFLVDPDNGEVALAYAFNFSPEFSRHNRTFSIAQSGRVRCLRTGRPLLLPSLGEGGLELDFLESLQKEAVQAFGDFPLITPDGRIGFLSVFFDTPHNFSPEETDLLQTFASQAALAVANARQYAHTDMALSRRAHQLSILEAVGRELSAAISSERLFDLILDYAMEFTNSQWGEFSLYNPQSRLLTVKSTRGYPQARLQFFPKESLAGLAVNSQQAVNIPDVRSESGYVDLTGGQARSQLCAPLIHEGRVLGALSLESDRLNAYTGSDQAFISQLATQAAVAVVNAELYSETQRRLREQSILYLISTQLVVNPELHSVLQTLARSMESAVQSASVGVYLWDEDQNMYLSHYHLENAARPGCLLPESIPYAGLESIHPSLVKTGPLRIGPKKGQELLGACKDCQALVLPLIASKKRLGMVLLHLPKGQIVTEEELQLLHAIVAEVSLSLHNALLFADEARGRDRLAAVLNSVNEGILMVETNGRIMLANEFTRTITGLASEQLINVPFEYLPEGALRSIGYTRGDAESLVRALEQGQASPAPRVTLSSSVEGKPELILERFTTPVWGQSGRVIGLIIVVRDTTEEQHLAQERELISSTLVHDLRSPVSSILSAVEIMNDSLAPESRDELVEQALKVSHNSATRVLGLIESLLDIARMQSGRMELKLGKLVLHELVANVGVEFSAQGTEFGVTFRNDIPLELPQVCIDQSKITRVITNLVDNAFKFTPTGGEVRVSAELASPDEVAVHISDTGPGIPAEYREKVFERFTQVPNSKGRRRGSGLGLTFCRMAVEAHGGRIWVDGRPAPETGSIFSFTLPINGPLVKN